MSCIGMLVGCREDVLCGRYRSSSPCPPCCRYCQKVRATTQLAKVDRWTAWAASESGGSRFCSIMMPWLSAPSTLGAPAALPGHALVISLGALRQVHVPSDIGPESASYRPKWPSYECKASSRQEFRCSKASRGLRGLRRFRSERET